MIVPGTFYTLVCDACGELMEGYEEMGYLVTESLTEADEQIRDRGWEKAEGGKLKCAACIEGDMADAR
jgi:hypothetical protein